MEMKNIEGYLDTTAGIALANVTREEKVTKNYMPLVYIASPYSSETEYNTEKARDYCRFAVSRGAIPLAPHLHYPQFMDDSDKVQRELGLRFALILLNKCDELWAFGDTVSDGMSREIAKARKRGITIRYFNNKCEVVSHA
ncbi:MAG: DUF4406 domain-containing protein [Clostridiales bacterium GWF2_38_85]|nr:MAG: DUF4406 domain-containing protein [Clostridiales bacterium GWF2_38_85]HBL84716.1 DUF4406 domain-containing protein [Clostridiales bacterium]